MNTFYVSDLDGTLLTEQATLSPFTQNTLLTLLKTGLPFTIATSRSLASVRSIVGHLPLSLPIVELNGAYITDLKTGQPLSINNLPWPLAIDLFSQMMAIGLSPLVSAFKDTEHRTYYTGISHAGLQWCLDDSLTHRGKPWQLINHLSDLKQANIVRFTLIDKGLPLQKFANSLHQQYGEALETHLFENPYQPDWYWLTVQDYRANKGAGIRNIQSAYGLDGHSLTVFGDHNNDIAMFKVADTALAMANATDQLKQHATDIIGHHSEDSVVRYLKQMWQPVGRE